MFTRPVTGGAEAPDLGSPLEHKTDVLARIADEVVVLERGAVALAGAAAPTLADPRLAELGVEPPAAVKLERMVREAGIEWSAALAEAIR